MPLTGIATIDCSAFTELARIFEIKPRFSKALTMPSRIIGIRP
jgi:hypothetical protein